MHFTLLMVTRPDAYGNLILSINYDVIEWIFHLRLKYYMKGY